MKGRSQSQEDRKRDEFIKRVATIWNVSREKALSRCSQGVGSSVRIHGLSSKSKEQVLARLAELGVDLEPIPWRDDAFYLESEKAVISESPLFREGDVYLQNASSLIPPLALDPQQGDCILDVCAAPGGKSIDIASLVNNECELWLNDAMAPRLQTLRELIEVYNVKTASVTNHQGQYLTKEIDQTFDRILLDAQCSGEGMIDLSHPKALRYWSLDRIKKFSHLQEKMLTEAFALLKPGGVLVYSTCTLAPEENEAPIDRLLRIRPEADLLPIEFKPTGAVEGLSKWQGKKFDNRLRHSMRVMPSERHEAFFVCKITRQSD